MGRASRYKTIAAAAARKRRLELGKKAPISTDERATQTRKLAELTTRRLETAASTNAEQFLKASGWLTATLLTINGAGMLSTLNVAERLTSPLVPAVLFGAGIFCTLLNVAAIQSLCAGVIDPLEERMKFWRGVEVFGAYDETEDKRLRTAMDSAYRFSWVPPALGWTGGILFFVGVGFLAAGLGDRPQSTAPKVEKVTR